MSAPLINKCLRDLVESKSSEDLTARCNGVRPLASLASISGCQAKIKLRAISEPEKAAQCKGVLCFLSLELMSMPWSLKK